MKTIADFKRALTLGRELKTTYHCKIIGRNTDGTVIYGNEDKGIRPVSIVQSNSFALKTNKREPIPAKGMHKNEQGVNEFNEYIDKVVDSWCQYPKAKEVVFNNENSLTILEEQRDGKMVPVLTYEFI